MISLPTEVLTILGINGNKIAVLGKYVEGVGYVNLAQKLGASFFQVADDIWKSLTVSEQWKMNKEFLDDMIAQGKEFIFSSNAYETLSNAPQSSFDKGINYLLKNGYRIIEDEWKMIK